MPRTPTLNERDLITNLEATAAKLAGRPVTVRIRKPAGANGRLCKSLDGRAVIDLDPALFEPQNVKQFAYIFSHEAAHARLHFASLPPVDIDAPPSMSDAKLTRVIETAKRTQPGIQRRESEADQLTAQWMQAVNNELGGYTAALDGDSVLAVLKILYHRTGKE